MKKVSILLVVSILFTAILLSSCTFVPLEERFFPTIEEAFANHSSGSRNMGEILFIDRHEDNLTVLHRYRGSRISHYVIKREDGKVLYACVGVTTGGVPLNPDDPVSIKQEQGSVALVFAKRILPESIGRRPLYGFSNYEGIYNLTINGQPVDYVVQSGINVEGEPVYFWYFSDAAVLYIEDLQREDVIICFGE